MVKKMTQEIRYNSDSKYQINPFVSFVTFREQSDRVVKLNFDAIKRGENQWA